MGITLGFEVVSEVYGICLSTLLMRVWMMRGFVIMEMIVGMIALTEQAKGGDVILVEYWKNEGVPRDSWDTGKSEVEDHDGIARWVIGLFG